MARLLDKIVIVDLEATCWENEPPKNQFSEIIEIGICTLDLKTLERGDKKSFIIKPENSTISKFCTQLTSITQEDVNKGIKLSEALDTIFKEYKVNNRTWVSFGDYDRTQLEKECKQKNIRNPFGKTHINVKNLFALKNKLPREVGMEKALNILNLPLEGTHHRGVDDAWNIALILSKLI